MKKIIIGFICVILFCSCGTSSKELISGKYVTIVDLNNTNYGFNFEKNSLDNYLKTAMEGTASSGVFTFDNGDFLFETSYRTLIDKRYFYEGEYEISENGEMIFHYQKLRSFDNGKSLEVEIDDNGDAFWHNKKVLLSALKSAEEYGGINFRMGGAYCREAATSFAEYFVKYMPTFQFNNDQGDTLTIYSKDNFLCKDVYGVTLTNEYVYGNKFTMSYNYIEAYKNDPNSLYNAIPVKSQDNLEEQIRIYSEELGCGGKNTSDFDTTIEFENGKWNWYDKEHNLINNGEYQESSTYQGLIVMYITNESKPSSEYLEEHYIKIESQCIYLYIDNGKIYFPALIKKAE